MNKQDKKEYDCKEHACAIRRYGFIPNMLPEEEKKKCRKCLSEIYGWEFSQGEGAESEDEE